MDLYADFLRDQATEFRQRAAMTDDPAIKEELLELAPICEEIAEEIERCSPGG